MDISLTYVLSQVLIVIYYLIYSYTFHLKDSKKILIIGILATVISSISYVLLNAYNDQQHKFPITSLVIEFIVRLKEKNLIDNLDLDSIFADKIIMKLYDEAEKYIGKK